jgi:hypothetical protein
MPNGHDRNWIRVCGAVDGFRDRHGHWPTRVRVMPACYVDLVAHILTPLGFALVNSIFELIPEDGAEMIAENDAGATYCYGSEGFPTREVAPSTSRHFGAAILRKERE